MACEHRQFTARVEVNRFDDLPGTFSADVTVDCAECGQAMQYLGLPIGFLWDQPATNADATVIHLPLQPYRKPAWLPEEAARLAEN